MHHFFISWQNEKTIGRNIIQSYNSTFNIKKIELLIQSSKPEGGNVIIKNFQKVSKAFFEENNMTPEDIEKELQELNKNN